MLKVVKDENGKKHRIYIDKKLEWTVPYLMKAKQLGIPVHRIRKIKGYHVPEDKTEKQQAQISSYGKGKYTITLLSKYQVLKTTEDGLKEVDGYECASSGNMFEDSIRNLAHEVSHIVVWDHNADRLILEGKLYYAFCRLAKKLGYKGF